LLVQLVPVDAGEEVLGGALGKSHAHDVSLIALLR
jgi:hypothetical protein